MTDPTVPKIALPQPCTMNSSRMDNSPDSSRRITRTRYRSRSNDPTMKVSRRVKKSDSGTKRVTSSGAVRGGRRSSRHQARLDANSFRRSNSTSKLEATGRSNQSDVSSPPPRRGSKTAGKRRSYQRQKSSSSAIRRGDNESKQ